MQEKRDRRDCAEEHKKFIYACIVKYGSKYSYYTEYQRSYRKNCRVLRKFAW